MITDDKTDTDKSMPIVNRSTGPEDTEEIRSPKPREEGLVGRAAKLEAVSKISTVLATILETDRVLQTVVDLTKEQLALYHAHIYLLDEPTRTLTLAAGAGDVGRQMVAAGWQISLDHEHSLVAGAARARQGTIANDVHNEPDYYANPLLPETRSEMAIPLIKGERLLGVLDVQADRLDHFTDEDINIVSILASQVAIILENARLFERIQQRAQRERTIREITEKLRAAPSLDILLKTAAHELGQRLGVPHTVLELGIEAHGAEPTQVREVASE